MTEGERDGGWRMEDGECFNALLRDWIGLLSLQQGMGVCAIMDRPLSVTPDFNQGTAHSMPPD